MRTLKRNKRPVAYAFYNGITELTDASGNYTGEYQINYTTPVKTLMNVSGGRGLAEIHMFGTDNQFSRTLVTDDLTTPFSTETVWWVEADPDTQPHNYRCTGVARTINQVVIALAEVNVGADIDTGDSEDP